MELTRSSKPELTANHSLIVGLLSLVVRHFRGHCKEEFLLLVIQSRQRFGKST